MDPHRFLETLAIILCVGAVTTVVFQRLRQPVVFGYLLAGMIVGPHVPIPIVVDAEVVETLAETGVVLLLFALGLEFSLGKLIRIGPTAGLVAIAQSGIMVLIGYSLGRLFGWTVLESVYTGAVIAISSTTIIAKAFDEQRVTGSFTGLVLGILIIEDLIAIFLLAILTTVSAGASLSLGSLAATGLRLAVFLAALIGIGLLLIPRLVRAIVRMNRPETTLVASMGICFAAALLALRFGYSVALGAFIAGSLVGESGEEKIVERLVAPVRDVFAAIFFVAVGMLIDPLLVARHWVPVLVFTVAVIVGKVVAVTVSSFLTGFRLRTSVQAGMSLAQIGEFSFIIAGVGLASGATRDFLYPVAVTVSAITTLTTPWLIRSADRAASFVDRILPRPLQTFVALYGSWIETLRRTRSETTGRARSRRLLGLLVLDGVMMIVVVIGTALQLGAFAALISESTGLSEEVAEFTVIAAAGVVFIPLLIGLVRTARRLGVLVATQALPTAERGPDLAAAPRTVLVVTVQLVLVFAVAVGVVAAIQPFLPRLGSAIAIGVVLGTLLLVLGATFWRSAADLHGHARAGAEVIVAALAQQMSSDGGAETTGQRMKLVKEILPGLGDPIPLRVPPGSQVVGRTLAAVNMRGSTGATILAILRESGNVPMPSATETLREGDILAVVGTDDAIEAARGLLGPAATVIQ